MGLPRRAVLALLCAALVVLAGLPTLHAGTRDAPEINDPSGDATDLVGQTVDWADLRAAWVVREGANLTFNVEVQNLTASDQSDAQDAEGQWNLNFTAGVTEYRVRASWSESDDLVVELLSGGGTVAGADLSGSIVNESYIQANWTGFTGEFDVNTTLTRLYAYTVATGTTSILFSTGDCQTESDAIDCAPDSGFGADAGPSRDIATFLNVTVAPTQAVADPGDQVNVSIAVNSSADEDVNATLSADAPQGLGTAFDNASLVIPAGGAVDRQLAVTVGPDARTNATYNVTVTLQPEGGNRITRTVQVLVPAPPPPPPPYGVDVRIVPAVANAALGASVAYDVQVTNTGTQEDIVDVAIVTGPGWASLARDAVVVAGGQSASVEMVIDVPADADTGQVGHEVRVTSRSDPSQTDSAFAVTEVGAEGGFFNQLDRQLKALGLGGLVPTIVLIIIVLVILLYVIWPYVRRRKVLEVEAEWVGEGDEPERGEGEGAAPASRDEEGEASWPGEQDEPGEGREPGDGTDDDAPDEPGWPGEEPEDEAGGDWPDETDDDAWDDWPDEADDEDR